MVVGLTLAAAEPKLQAAAVSKTQALSSGSSSDAEAVVVVVSVVVELVVVAVVVELVVVAVVAVVAVVVAEMVVVEVRHCKSPGVLSSLLHMVAGTALLNFDRDYIGPGITMFGFV